MRGRAVLSNTSPTTPYRAAGRPEVMYIIERLIDLAARHHGFDRVALRRRNLVRDVSRTATARPRLRQRRLSCGAGACARARRLGRVRESPTQRHAGAVACAASAWGTTSSSTPARRASAPRSRCCPMAESTSCSARSPPARDTRRASPQLVADWFCVELRPKCGFIDRRHGSWRRSAAASHSGRSMRMGAVVMASPATAIIEKGRGSPARMLEAAASDIEFANGRFTVKGTDRSVGLFEVAASAELRAELRRNHAAAVLSLRLRGVRGGDRSGDGRGARSCATPPWTTAVAP